MMKTQIEKAFTLSLICAIYFNTFLVLLKELQKPVKQFLHSYLLHHWVGHGIAVIVFFLLLGLLFRRLSVNVNLQKMPLHIVSSIVISSIGISIFYLTNVH
ncbi:MAG TPA: hypothetical protein VGF79_12870 [Bacteroidia bacterium]